MKAILTGLVLTCLLLTGCASRYTLTLNNGNRITSKGKPKLKNGYYVFEDAQGKPAAVAAGRVKEVSPSNMNAARTSSGYSATPMK